MAYNPLNGTLSTKPYSVSTPVPDGGRTYKYDEAYNEYRPFMDLAEVIAEFPTTISRKGHFAVVVNTGGTYASGVITGGTNEEYWWKDNYTNGGLVQKNVGGGGGGGTTIGEIDDF